MNGKALADLHDPKDPTKIVKTAGQQLDGFGAAAGRRLDDVRQLAPLRRLHRGRQQRAAPRQRRSDGPRACSTTGPSRGRPTGASCTTAPRPTPRASPGIPTRAGIAWNGEKWVGDVPDIKPDSPPGDVRRLHHAARGRRPPVRAGARTTARSPSTTRPVEAPVDNPLHPKVTLEPGRPRSSPPTRTSTATKEDFPIVCTTYRLTEHFHYWTQHQHDGRLNQLQPGFFVEIPEALAREKGIANGSQVKVVSRARRRSRAWRW